MNPDVLIVGGSYAGIAAGLILARRTERDADTLLGAGAEAAGSAGARGELETHEGAQGAVGGLGAGIDVDAGEADIAGGVTVRA